MRPESSSSPLYTNVSLRTPAEFQQVGIQLVLMRIRESVRSTRINLQRRVSDELRRCDSPSPNRHHLIVIAMQHQGGHVKLLQVLSEVRLGKRFDAIESILVSPKHSLHPKPIDKPL